LVLATQNKRGITGRGTIRAVPRARALLSASAEFQLLCSLKENRRQRARQGRFLVEGVRAIDVAVERGWPIASFLHPDGRQLSAWARGLLDSRVAAEQIAVAPELWLELSDRDDPSELLAVLELPEDDLARIRPGLAVVFDRPSSPGNLGSVIRSADAFGADGVVVTGHAADPYDPQSVRASQGALFALPVVRAGGGAEVDAWLEQSGVRIVGSSAHGDVPLGEADVSGDLVLVVGNEAQGMSTAWRERCDQVVAIPAAGVAGSLNVAAAAAILLYEVRRRRSAGGAA
jgi:23S rRNA (uridine2479-2'-O)-methyltransferase